MLTRALDSKIRYDYLTRLSKLGYSLRTIDARVLTLEGGTPWNPATNDSLGACFCAGPLVPTLESKPPKFEGAGERLSDMRAVITKESDWWQGHERRA